MRLTCAVLIVSGCLSTPVLAQSPVPVDTIATVANIEALITQNVSRLEKSLADASKFDDLKEKGIRESFGMLSVLGQALAEHSDRTESKINGPALRDAALAYNNDGTHEEAVAAFKQVQDVLAGKVTGDHVKFHSWGKLIGMAPMMEELNASNSEILRVLRRPRGKDEEVLPAVKWGLLSLTMKVDTHAVQKPEDLSKWNGWSDEFREASLKLAEAIRNKDGTEGRKWFDKGNAACEACHEVFQ
jgi:hypothetical protein